MLLVNTTDLRNRIGELSSFMIIPSHTRQIPCEYLFKRLLLPSKVLPVHFSTNNRHYAASKMDSAVNRESYVQA